MRVFFASKEGGDPGRSRGTGPINILLMWECVQKSGLSHHQDSIRTIIPWQKSLTISLHPMTKELDNTCVSCDRRVGQYLGILWQKSCTIPLHTMTEELGNTHASHDKRVWQHLCILWQKSCTIPRYPVGQGFTLSILFYCGNWTLSSLCQWKARHCSTSVRGVLDIIQPKSVYSMALCSLYQWRTGSCPGLISEEADIASVYQWRSDIVQYQWDAGHYPAYVIGEQDNVKTVSTSYTVELNIFKPTSIEYWT